MLLKQARENRIEPIHNKAFAIAKLCACAFKPLGTAEWWTKTLSFMENLLDQVPCYQLEFDLSGEAANLLRDL